MKKRIVAISILCCLLLAIGLMTGATGSKSYTAGAYYQPASNDYYVTAKKIETMPNTVEARVWLNAISDDSRHGVIFGNYEETKDAAFNLEIFSGRHPRVLLVNNAGEAQSYVFSKVTLEAETFIHLAVVRDTTNQQLLCYVNGELQETLGLFGDQTVTIDSYFGVGGDLKDDNRTYFNGEIESVVLFEDVRTAEEISVDVEAVSTDAEGLVANWNFDGFVDEQGSVAAVAGGNDLLRSAEWVDNFDVGEYDYTIAAVPDTQWLNYYNSDYYYNEDEKVTGLYEWLVSNKENKKIRAVLGLGDITEKSEDAEWQRADKVGTYLKTSGLPYTMVTGNHDLYASTLREQFDTAFPVSEFSDTSYWGGCYEGEGGNTVTNSYYNFTFGNTKFLVFALEFGPRDEVLQWAGEIIAQNSDKQVIITTHAYINDSGERIWAGSGGSTEPPSELYGYNDGTDIWEKLVSKYKNIAMIICGHAGGNLLVQQATGEGGNTVTEILCDATGLDSRDGTYAAGTVCLLHMKEQTDGSLKVQPVLYSTVKEKYYKPNYRMAFTIDAIQ